MRSDVGALSLAIDLPGWKENAQATVARLATAIDWNRRLVNTFDDVGNMNLQFSVSGDGDLREVNRKMFHQLFGFSNELEYKLSITADSSQNAYDFKIKYSNNYGNHSEVSVTKIDGNFGKLGTESSSRQFVRVRLYPGCQIPMRSSLESF